MERHILDLFSDNILKKSAEYFGVNLDVVKKVGGFENFIYEYNKDNQDYILRITHSDHRELNMVQAELEWLDYLAKNDANVCMPVQSVNGNFVECVYHDNGTYFIITSFEKAKGAHMKKEDATPEFFEEYGRVIGKLHRLTKDYKPKDSSIKRFEWDEETFLKKAQDYLPKEEYVIYERLIQVMDYFNTLPKDRDSYGLIHTDIHAGNFFIDNGKITVFDFDDSSYKWFISDIAIALFYPIVFSIPNEKRIDFVSFFMKHFIKGYREENKLDDYWIKQLPYFLKLREIILYIVICRSCDMNNLDDWAKHYIDERRDIIINDLPFIDYKF